MLSQKKSLNLTRREFLTLLGVWGIGTGLAACAPSPTATPTTVPTKAVVPTTAPPVAPTQAPATATPAKPFAGKTVRVMMVGNPQWDALKAKMIPDFEAKTGIKVVIEPYGFDVLQQRLDLELSTGSGVYDVVQMVMILIGRTIRAGWAEDLMPYAKRDNYDLSDFVPGTLVNFQSGNGLYALPWSPDAMVVAYRKDLFDKAGVTKFPETFDELLAVAPKIHSKDTAFFTCENNWHWIWPLFLQSYGGNFFVKPPDDLTPTFNTPEAVKATQVMVDLLTKYSLANAVNVDIPGTQAAMQQGKAAVILSGLGVASGAIEKGKSLFIDQIAFGHVPKGPVGWFPQLATHGYMIPSSSKQKDAAWEVTKWLASQEMELFLLTELNQLARNRKSILQDAKLKERFRRGVTDVAKLEEESMTRAGAGYMAYRIVPPFKPLGARINVAFGEMISGQKTVKAALDALQTDSIDILIQAGFPPKK